MVTGAIVDVIGLLAFLAVFAVLAPMTLPVRFSVFFAFLTSSQFSPSLSSIHHHLHNHPIIIYDD